MRASTILLVLILVPLVLACLLAIACGIAIGVLKSGVNRAQWNVTSMRVDSVSQTATALSLELSFWAGVNVSGCAS